MLDIYLYTEKPKIEIVFEDFRKKYCGTKRGLEIEFNLFKPGWTNLWCASCSARSTADLLRSEWITAESI